MYPYGFYGYTFGPEFLILLPAIIFAMYAQSKINTTFNKYLKLRNKGRYSGSQVARMILDRNGLYDVKVEHINGKLTDHYDPRKKILRLSNDVYAGFSIAALGVAAHEAGHAIQHASGYRPLMLRNSIAPIASFGSRFVWIIVILGFIVSPILLQVGIALYLAIVVFQIITLPVEYNASKRAMIQLQNGIISYDEVESTKKVLDAAALTYVAATLVAIAQLLRLLSISRRRN